MALLLPICLGERNRTEYLKKISVKPTVFSRTVTRKNIHSSVLSLFGQKGVEDEFPLRISFEGERAVDIGGVYRDMLSAFWEDAYDKFFDGGCLLTPFLHPQSDHNALSVLGKILSHGYLGCGFLPPRIAFPTLTALLLRTSNVSDEILVTTLLKTVGAVEADALRTALAATSEFSGHQQIQLASILGRFGSMQRPTCKGLRQQIIQVAKFEFLTRPTVAISSGVPESHRGFWNILSVKELHAIYLALSATPEKVLEQLQESTVEDSSQDRVLGYLRQYIGNMRGEELGRFLRFVTGLPVCTTQSIKVTFNSLTGLSRRPIAHACAAVLELPSSYNSLGEFTREFQAILSGDEDKWRMDGI